MSYAMMALVAVMVHRAAVSSGRRVNKLVDQKFPEEHRKRLAARFLRRQPSIAAAPDADAAPAGPTRRQSHLTERANVGARRYPVGQVAVGGNGDRRVVGPGPAGALRGHRTERRRRPLLVGSGSPPTGRAGPRIGRRSNPPMSQRCCASTATATLVDDLGGWLAAVLDRRDAWDGASVSADIDELLDAIAVSAHRW